MGILADMLFPRKCVLCGTILDRGETDICPKCRIDAPECAHSKQKLHFLDSWASVWYYEGSVRRSLLRYKFYGKRSYAQSYAHLLAAKLMREYPEGFDLVTWVPVSTLRRIRRGYDQVALIARALAPELGMTAVPLLKKTRNNPPQSSLADYSHRRANVLGIYCMRKNADVRGKRILLIDDVLTTGATAGECARVLLTAGAKEVHCGVIAASHKGNSE